MIRVAVVEDDPRLRRAIVARLRRQSGFEAVGDWESADEAARQVVQRTGATAEGMEGAAVALVAVRHALAFAELRVISNTTGRRAGQVWKLPEALARLGALARQIAR